MSEQSWPTKVQLPPMLRPEMMIGAASPLWGYFAGAALMGSAWWWMTRWMQPTNLAAIADAVGGPVAVALMDDEGPALPVGGESAPFSTAVLEAEVISEPALAADLAQAPEPVLAPEPAVIPEPVLAAEPEIKPEPEPEPEPKSAAAPAPTPTPKRKTRESEAKPH